MLEILRTSLVRNGDAIGRLVEYCGEAVEELSIDERATMTNMAAEVGAFTGIVAAGQQDSRFSGRAWILANRSRTAMRRICKVMKAPNTRTRSR